MTKQSLGWHVIAGEDLLTALRRCAEGENPDLVYAELWANAEHERVEPYPEFAADVVESLREWVMDNEFVPDAEFRCSKRRAMALLDWCDGLFREARAE